MDNLQIINLGDWAEDDFSGRCARAGVTRNKSVQDRTGWDYLVEFPASEVSGVPADLQPASMSARVQVKSKERGRPYVDLKLSNALRFAKDSMPCFLVLYQASEGGEPVRIFVRHFWNDEIASALRAARKADEVGRSDLHRMKVRYAFSEDDEHTHDLVAWLASVLAGRSGYAGEKLALVTTIGFEEGSIHGELTFAVGDLEALIDHQIGLKEVAPSVNVTIKRRRFGINAKTPLFSGEPKVARIRSHPRPARVRVRPSDGEDIWLDGELFLPAIHGPLELMKLRVVADFLEIVVNATNDGKVTLDRGPDCKLRLASHRALIEVMRSAAAGSLKLLVTCEGFPNIPAEVTLPDIVEDDAFREFSNVITCFEKVSAGILPPDLAVSRREIGIAWNAIVDFNSMVTGTNFTGSFEFEKPPSNLTGIPTVTFFFDYVEVGDWVFGAVVRRAIERFELERTTVRFALGPARVVEALVRRASGQEIIDELCNLYQQAFQPEIKAALEMFGGSFRSLLAFDGNGAEAAIENHSTDSPDP